MQLVGRCTTPPPAHLYPSREQGMTRKDAAATLQATPTPCFCFAESTAVDEGRSRSHRLKPCLAAGYLTLFCRLLRLQEAITIGSIGGVTGDVWLESMKGRDKGDGVDRRCRRSSWLPAAGTFANLPTQPRVSILEKSPSKNSHLPRLSIPSQSSAMSPTPVVGVSQPGSSSPTLSRNPSTSTRQVATTPSPLPQLSPPPVSSSPPVSSPPLVLYPPPTSPPPPTSSPPPALSPPLVLRLPPTAHMTELSYSPPAMVATSLDPSPATLTTSLAVSPPQCFGTTGEHVLKQREDYIGTKAGLNEGPRFSFLHRTVKPAGKGVSGFCLSPCLAKTNATSSFFFAT
nr:hypothetical protein Iba_chr14bCG12490 [Ipomoea batatas]